MISSIVLLFIFMTTLFSTLWLIQWTIEALKKRVIHMLADNSNANLV